MLNQGFTNGSTEHGQSVHIDLLQQGVDSIRKPGANIMLKKQCLDRLLAGPFSRLQSLDQFIGFNKLAVGPQHPGKATFGIGHFVTIGSKHALAACQNFPLHFKGGFKLPVFHKQE